MARGGEPRRLSRMGLNWQDVPPPKRQVRPSWDNSGGCKNKGSAILCNLTPAEEKLRQRLEKMKADRETVCATGGVSCFEPTANPYENAWCAEAGPADCAGALFASSQADEYATRVYPGGEPGGNGSAETKRKWNAFHHAFWFALIGSSGNISEDDAMLLGAAHEMGAYLKRNYESERGRTNHDIDYGTVDSRADVRNDASGYRIGAKMPRGPQAQLDVDKLAARVKAAVEAGRLDLSG